VRKPLRSEDAHRGNRRQDGRDLLRQLVALRRQVGELLAQLCGTSEPSVVAAKSLRAKPCGVSGASVFMYNCSTM